MKFATSFAVLAVAGSALAGPHKHAHLHHRRHAHAHAEVQVANTLDARDAAPVVGAPKKATAPVTPPKKAPAPVVKKSTLQTTTKPAPKTSAAKPSATLASRAAQAVAQPPTPTTPGSAAGCTKWAAVSGGFYCQLMADLNGITLDQFYAWNPQVNQGGACANLWAGYSYCVGVSGSGSAPAASAASAAPQVQPSKAAAPAPAVQTTQAPAPASAAPVAPAAPTSAATPSPAPAAASSPAPQAQKQPDTAAAAQSVNSAVYKSYNGDGSTFPSMTQWATFEQMWSNNQNNIAVGCGSTGAVGAQANSASETQSVHDNILSVAAATKDSNGNALDPRFVLAIVLQESWGCVRVRTTNYGVNNPGLMQDHNGAASCAGSEYMGAPGSRQECPDSTIRQMIVDGTQGTNGVQNGGDGLQQTYNQALGDGLSGAEAYYAAAKIYNGGAGGYASAVAAKSLAAGCCTPSYVSDVVNKLVGFGGGSSSFSAA